VKENNTTAFKLDDDSSKMKAARAFARLSTKEQAGFSSSYARKMTNTLRNFSPTPNLTLSSNATICAKRNYHSFKVSKKQAKK
jgi:hypothetical protein